MAKTLRAIHPNAGLRRAYQKRLEDEVRRMAHSIEYWMRAAYRSREGEIAQDASPARFLSERLGQLIRHWTKRWDTFAETYARWFAYRSEKTTDAALTSAMNAAGLTVKFTRSRIENDVVQALIAENVGLIKSIPAQYLQDVNGIVQRGVAAGRDISQITEELTRRYAITRRRARLIARDQTNKASEAIKRVRAKELGVTEAIWVHVPGVKTSRRTHQAMNGKRYVIAEGLYDSAVGRKVQPAELVCCQCTCRYVVPEFGD